jgi:hypothetical protein
MICFRTVARIEPILTQ